MGDGNGPSGTQEFTIGVLYSDYGEWCKTGSGYLHKA